MGSEIALSIIVSTIGRPDDLRRLIESLVAQDAPGTFELIVVDQSNDGNCVTLLAELDRLSLWHVADALRTLGFDERTGRRFAIVDEAARLRVVPRHARLFGRLL